MTIRILLVVVLASAFAAVAGGCGDDDDTMGGAYSDSDADGDSDSDSDADYECEGTYPDGETECVDGVDQLRVCFGGSWKTLPCAAWCYRAWPDLGALPEVECAQSDGIDVCFCEGMALWIYEEDD